MRCAICDKMLTEPEYNRDHQEWDPCQECLDVIADAVGSFTDRPSMDEDEYGQGSLPFETIVGIADMRTSEDW